MLRVADILTESIVDGPGIRSVVFFQGCSHDCRGCHNPSTHTFAGGTLCTPEELAAKVLSGLTPLHRGITLSGGDPLQQDESDLVSFISLLKKARPELNIWIYTGYTYEEVKNQKGLSLAQVLVDGPFVLARRNLELPFRGSDNQRLIDLEATRKCGQVRLWSRQKRAENI